MCSHACLVEHPDGVCPAFAISDDDACEFGDVVGECVVTVDAGDDNAKKVTFNKDRLEIKTGEGH